jgi:hypothetical protein
MQNFSGTNDNCDVSLTYEDLVNVIEKIESIAIFSIQLNEGESIYSVSYLSKDFITETFSIRESLNGYTIQYDKSIDLKVDEMNTLYNITVYDIASANFMLSQCTQDEVCPCTHNGFFLPSRFQIIPGQTDNKLFLFYYIIINAYRIGIDIEENEKYLDLDVLYNEAKDKTFHSMQEFETFFEFLFTGKVDDIKSKLLEKLENM